MRLDINPAGREPSLHNLEAGKLAHANEGIDGIMPSANKIVQQVRAGDCGGRSKALSVATMNQRRPCKALAETIFTCRYRSRYNVAAGAEKLAVIMDMLRRRVRPAARGRHNMPQAR